MTDDIRLAAGFLFLGKNDENRKIALADRINVLKRNNRS